MVNHIVTPVILQQSGSFIRFGFCIILTPMHFIFLTLLTVVYLSCVKYVASIPIFFLVTSRFRAQSVGRGSISAWCKDVMQGPFSVCHSLACILFHTSMLTVPLKVALVLQAESLRSERGVGLIKHVH